MSTYRIVIDRTLCSGFGACAEHAPELIELDSSGLADARTGETDDERILDAADACPMGAIAVYRRRKAANRRPEMSSVLIVGGGLAGARCAETLRAGRLRRATRRGRRRARTLPTSAPPSRRSS